MQAKLLFLSLGLSASALALYANSPVQTFPGVRCSEVDLSTITFDGRPFDAARDRLAIYGNGSIVIADGLKDPLIIYTGEGCSGDSLLLNTDILYRGTLQGAKSYLEERELGLFDNSVRSFRLKNGYMCTMANNPDGTGFSRVFIADDGDLVIDSMPEGLGYVSFIRVCRHDWIGKKGVSADGELADLSRSSWCYDWGAAAESNIDHEYVPMRHNRWWDSWENIGSRVNTTSVLGFNEPDHADQSDMNTDIAIQLWPELMKTGLRIGSPAPDNIDSWWLKEFLAKADSLNYRADFVATHMYWNSQDPKSLADRIDRLCADTYGGRPMWITEMNNGANWTNEWWPDREGPQRDANFNIVYDSIGNTIPVVRPHTEGNSAVQVKWIKGMLEAFDNSRWLERHAIYNWVEDARALWLDGADGPELTPAGKVFAAYDSKPAFNREAEYVHRWRISPPRIDEIIKSGQRVRVKFYDNNGENALGYRAERRIDKGEWKEFAFLKAFEDYTPGKACYLFDHEMPGGFQEYRFIGVAKDGSESIYSRVTGIQVPYSGVGETADESGLLVKVAEGGIIIRADRNGWLLIHGADGSVVREVLYHPGENYVCGLGKGVYIIAGNKYML
jgi:hypothetical protein